MTLDLLETPLGLTVPPVRAEPFDRLPGSAADDPSCGLAAGWLVGPLTNTATAYPRLEAWVKWCAQLDVSPLAAERHHGGLWVRHLKPAQPRTGLPPRQPLWRGSCPHGPVFYDYGDHDARALTHSPAAMTHRHAMSPGLCLPGPLVSSVTVAADRPDYDQD